MNNKSIKTNKHFWTWLVVLSFISRPIHEFGHWIVYKIYSIDVYFTLKHIL